jgi:sugar lactone lactonase YvrE
MNAKKTFYQNSKILVLLGVGILIVILVLGSNIYELIKSENWESFTRQNSGLIDEHISAIAIDSSERVWFGTGSSSFSGGGVSVFDGENWESYTTQNSDLVDNNVYVIAIDSSDRVWFGTEEGVSVFDGKIWKTYTTQNSGLVHNFINAIAIDSSDRVWFSTGRYNDSEVSVFDGKIWKTYSTQNSGLEFSLVKTIAIDSSDRVWVGGAGGVSVLNGNIWKTYNTQNSGLESNLVQTIAIDSSDRVWVGSDASGVIIMDGEVIYHGGVSVYDGENWITYTPRNSGLVFDEVHTIAFDSSDRVWFGGGSAISVFDGENWETYTPENSGLIRAVIAKIVPDNQGFMWIGGGIRGINRVPIGEQLQINPIYTSIRNLLFSPKFSLWLNILLVIILGSVAFIVIDRRREINELEPISDKEQSEENKISKRRLTRQAAAIGAVGSVTPSIIGILYIVNNGGSRSGGLGDFFTGIVLVLISFLAIPVGLILVGPVAGIVGLKVFKTKSGAFLFGLLAQLFIEVPLIWLLW